MGWSNFPKPKPPEDGVWHQHDIGCGITDWWMTCGAFRAEIRRVGDGPYYLCINRHPILHDPSLNFAMRRAEEELVWRIESVLPGFETIKARLASRSHGSAD